MPQDTRKPQQPAGSRGGREKSVQFNAREAYGGPVRCDAALLRAVDTADQSSYPHATSQLGNARKRCVAIGPVRDARFLNEAASCRQVVALILRGLRCVMSTWLIRTHSGLLRSCSRAVSGFAGRCNATPEPLRRRHGVTLESRGEGLCRFLRLVSSQSMGRAACCKKGTTNPAPAQ